MTSQATPPRDLAVAPVSGAETTPAGWGGRRAGAGHPRKPEAATLERARLRAIAVDLVRAQLAAELTPLLVAYLEAAKGAYVMVARGPDGQWSRVTDEAAMVRCLQIGAPCYRLERTKPDVRALIDALDRLCGKPTTDIEVTATVAPTTVVHIIHEYHSD